MKNSFYIVIQLLVVLSNLCGVLAAPSFANASAGLARADSSTTEWLASVRRTSSSVSRAWPQQDKGDDGTEYRDAKKDSNQHQLLVEEDLAEVWASSGVVVDAATKIVPSESTPEPSKDIDVNAMNPLSGVYLDPAGLLGTGPGPEYQPDEDESAQEAGRMANAAAASASEGLPSSPVTSSTMYAWASATMEMPQKSATATLVTDE